VADFQLVITGDRAAERAAELEEQMRAIWPSAGVDWSAVRQANAPEPTRTEALEIATFVLAIPSAVLAAMDIAERVKLADKLKKLLAWARGKPIQARLPGGRELLLEEGDPGEWIDIAVDVESTDLSKKGSTG
jgi:hypothetical protein